MIRRINMVGGPGIGKSTLSAAVFGLLHARHYNIEIVTEYVKSMIYNGYKLRDWDSLKSYAEQLHREAILLRNGVDLIVTCCPVYAPYIYARHHGLKGTNGMFMTNMEFEAEFKSINVQIQRHVPFIQEGRVHDLEASKRVDGEFADFLEQHQLPVLSYHPSTSVETLCESLTRLGDFPKPRIV